MSIKYVGKTSNGEAGYRCNSCTNVFYYNIDEYPEACPYCGMGRMDNHDCMTGDCLKALPDQELPNTNTSFCADGSYIAVGGVPINGVKSYSMEALAELNDLKLVTISFYTNDVKIGGVPNGTN